MYKINIQTKYSHLSSGNKCNLNLYRYEQMENNKLSLSQLWPVLLELVVVGQQKIFNSRVGKYFSILSNDWCRIDDGKPVEQNLESRICWTNRTQRSRWRHPSENLSPLFFTFKSRKRNFLKPLYSLWWKPRLVLTVLAQIKEMQIKTLRQPQLNFTSSSE